MYRTRVYKNESASFVKLFKKVELVTQHNSRKFELRHERKQTEAEQKQSKPKISGCSNSELDTYDYNTCAHFSN